MAYFHEIVEFLCGSLSNEFLIISLLHVDVGYKLWVAVVFQIWLVEALGSIDELEADAVYFHAMVVEVS